MSRPAALIIDAYYWCWIQQHLRRRELLDLEIPICLWDFNATRASFRNDYPGVRAFWKMAAGWTRAAGPAKVSLSESITAKLPGVQADASFYKINCFTSIRQAKKKRSDVAHEEPDL